MAFTATIQSVTPTADSTGVSINWIVVVLFADSVSAYVSTKTYSFPLGTTQASAVATISADGTNLKTVLGSASTLAGKIGSVIIL